MEEVYRSYLDFTLEKQQKHSKFVYHKQTGGVSAEEQFVANRTKYFGRGRVRASAKPKLRSYTKQENKKKIILQLLYFKKQYL